LGVVLFGTYGVFLEFFCGCIYIFIFITINSILRLILRGVFIIFFLDVVYESSFLLFLCLFFFFLSNLLLLVIQTLLLYFLDFSLIVFLFGDETFQLGLLLVFGDAVLLRVIVLILDLLEYNFV